MSELPKLWVEYPAADPQAEPVVVESVTSRDVDYEFTRGVVRVIQAAYMEQFKGTRVPEWALKETFDPFSHEEIVSRQAIISNRVQKGSSNYWVVRGNEPGHLDGLAKTVHGYRRTYVGDIVVAPPWRRGLGSRLLHAALSQSGRDETNTVDLEAFEGSSVNTWYEKLGFVPGARTEYFLFGNTGYTLPLQKYEIPRQLGLGGLVRNLEERTPALRQAVVRHAS